MDGIQRPNDFLPLTIDQIRDLAAALREEFGDNLSRADFPERLLMLRNSVAAATGCVLAPARRPATFTDYVRAEAFPPAMLILAPLRVVIP
ncbi:hypothetical protein [Burkholderia ubonensis]|uniref:hypothetical protein n=1 Tax=Burkholderia ubonensis TaxID=101571 RepID=UPI00075D6AD8|nr:hypothetical protein [Burkholderia ubonensis]KWK82723.1 hypothetical protein WM17_16390 [Burkholderia ubonensis]KWK93548.1 hypothetical protein WM18_16010 [Burkholderia ubonensis]